MLHNLHVVFSVGSPSVSSNDAVCAVSDESACDSTVQSWKHTGAHWCHNDSLLFGLKWMKPCDVCLLQQQGADQCQSAVHEVRDLYADLSTTEASSSHGKIHRLHLSLLFIVIVCVCVCMCVFVCVCVHVHVYA